MVEDVEMVGRSPLATKESELYDNDVYKWPMLYSNLRLKGNEGLSALSRRIRPLSSVVQSALTHCTLVVRIFLWGPTRVRHIIIVN